MSTSEAAEANFSPPAKPWPTPELSELHDATIMWAPDAYDRLTAFIESKPSDAESAYALALRATIPTSLRSRDRRPRNDANEAFALTPEEPIVTCAYMSLQPASSEHTEQLRHAARTLESRLIEAPRDWHSCASLVSIWALLGERENIATLRQRLKDLDDDSSLALKCLRLELITEEEYEEGLALADEILQHEPHNALANLLGGDISLALNGRTQTQKYWGDLPHKPHSQTLVDYARNNRISKAIFKHFGTALFVIAICALGSLLFPTIFRVLTAIALLWNIVKTCRLLYDYRALGTLGDFARGFRFSFAAPLFWLLIIIGCLMPWRWPLCLIFLIYLVAVFGPRILIDAVSKRARS